MLSNQHPDKVIFFFYLGQNSWRVQVCKPLFTRTYNKLSYCESASKVRKLDISIPYRLTEAEMGFRCRSPGFFAPLVILLSHISCPTGE